MIINIPDEVKFIIDTFYKKGYEAFMVGGCIRDSLLLKSPKDYDIATSAPPDITEKLFEKTIPTGIQHGTITVLINKKPFEVTTYRTEGEYKDNRRPDSVSFVTDIKEDLSRRDFTINAFAFNEKEGLKDYFNGLDDLNNKIIRTVGNSNKRFKEDALRMLRAIRFSSQLDFKIEETTLEGIIKNRDLIQNISAERIRDELCKMLISNNVTKGILLLKNTNLLELTIPELNENFKKDEAFNETIKMLMNTPNNLNIRLAALFYSMRNSLNLSNNDTVDINLVRKILRKLRFDNKTISIVTTLLREDTGLLNSNDDIELKKLLNRLSLGNVPLFLDLTKSYIKSLDNNSKLLDSFYNFSNRINSIIDSKDPLTIKDLNIDGGVIISKLKVSPGKIIGEILNHLLYLVLENPNLNNEDFLLKESSNYIRKREIN